MDLQSESPARRRRGKELEDALLDAAWEQLAEHGYEEFTFEAVAERAGTSRPVLSRRWKTRVELVVAAVKHDSEQSRVPIPDTGTLRDDVIELLLQANDRRLRTAAVLTVQLGPYFEETGTAPSDLRAILIGDRAISTEVLLRRAMERGEIPTRDLPARVISLPFDLARGELLMTRKPLDPTVIEHIVDDVFLPLVAPESHQP